MKILLAGMVAVLGGYLGYLYLAFDTLDSCEALNHQLVQRILDDRAIAKPKNFLTSSLIRTIAEIPAELYVENETAGNQVKCAHRLLTGGFKPSEMLE